MKSKLKRLYWTIASIVIFLAITVGFLVPVLISWDNDLLVMVGIGVYILSLYFAVFWIYGIVKQIINIYKQLEE